MGSTTHTQEVTPNTQEIPPNIYSLLEDPLPYTYQITVHGDPVPKGRPRFTSRNGFNRVYTPKKTKLYEELIRNQLKIKYPHINTISQPVHVQIIAVFKRPQRLKTKKSHQGLILHTKRPDLDNVAKAIFDALNSILHDDAIICSMHSIKFYSEINQNPRTIIKIKTLKDSPHG